MSSASSNKPQPAQRQPVQPLPVQASAASLQPAPPQPVQPRPANPQPAPPQPVQASGAQASATQASAAQASAAQASAAQASAAQASAASLQPDHSEAGDSEMKDPDNSPDPLPQGEVLYFIDSTHRGEMYQIRAARTLCGGPLLVHNCDEDPAELEKPAELDQYLGAPSVSPFGRTSAKGRGLFKNPMEDKFFRIRMKGAGEPRKVQQSDFVTVKKDLKYVTESECTINIVNHFKQILEKGNPKTCEAELVKLAKGIAQIDPSVQDKVDEMLGPLLITIFGSVQVKEKSRAVLLMYRATGRALGEHAYTDEDNANKKRKTLAKGVYPENDTDDGENGVCAQINAIVQKARYQDKAGAKLVLCGNSTPITGIDSIFEWFKLIDLTKLDDITRNVVTARDVEARFMQLAFEKRYINLVIGFRSGALDMFTFLGIPTVSIQLDGLVGDSRMTRLSPNVWTIQDKLNYLKQSQVKIEPKLPQELTEATKESAALLFRGANVFKRCNISYATPRHDATKIMESSRRPAWCYNSPFWTDGFKQNCKTTPAEMRELHEKPPGPLAKGPQDLARVEEQILWFMSTL